MAGFDPYFEWLGIPSREQPPTCYRLVGVDLFEKDSRAIDEAATQRIGSLRAHQTGPHADVAQRVITEVSAARITLLNSARRAEYDNELQSAMLAEKSPPPRPEPKPEEAPPPERPKRRRRRPAEDAEAESDPPPKRRLLDRAFRRRLREEEKEEDSSEVRPPISLPALLGILGAAALVIIGLLAFLNSGGDDEPEPDSADVQAESPLPPETTTAEHPTGPPNTPPPGLEPVTPPPATPISTQPPIPTGPTKRGTFYASGGKGEIELYLNGRRLPLVGLATTETRIQDGDVVLVRVRGGSSPFRAFRVAFLTSDERGQIGFQASDLCRVTQPVAEVTTQLVNQGNAGPGPGTADSQMKEQWDALRIPADQSQWLWGSLKDSWEQFAGVIRLDRIVEVPALAEVPRPPDTPTATPPTTPGTPSTPPSTPSGPPGPVPLSFADVEITQDGKWGDLRKGVKLRSTAVDAWGEIPSILAGCQFSQTAGHTLGLRVVRPGVVLVATTQRWESAGSMSASELQSVLSQAKLEALGWHPLAELPTTGGQNLRWLVFCRDCRQGETLTLRTEKFLAPLFIRPTSLGNELVAAVRTALGLPAAEVDDPAFADLPVVVPGSRPIAYTRLDPRQVPAELVSATTFQFPDTGEAEVRSGLLTFTVKQPVTAYLIAHWKYEGNNEGNWMAEQLTREKLVADGWEDLGPVAWDAEVFLFRKALQPGLYRMRTNKYTAPQLILPADGTMPLAGAGPVLQAGRRRVTNAEVQLAEQQLAGVLASAVGGSDAQRLADAQRLLDRAAQLRAEPAQQFVLLQHAMEEAGEAGDAELMLRAVDAITADFEIDTDPLAAKTTLLQNFAEKAATAPRIASFVAAADPVIEEALRQQKTVAAYSVAELADQLGQTAEGAAVRERARQRLTEVSARLTDVDVLEIYQLRLRANPDDPATNDGLGQWLCLAKGDWARGLPYLAKGPATELSAAARKDLLRPATPKEQAELGDAWWKLSETAADDGRTALELRAASWYQEALPQLIGAPRQKIEKRLELLPAEVRGNIPRP